MIKPDRYRSAALGENNKARGRREIGPWEPYNGSWMGRWRDGVLMARIIPPGQEAAGWYIWDGVDQTACLGGACSSIDEGMALADQALRSLHLLGSGMSPERLQEVLDAWDQVAGGDSG